MTDETPVTTAAAWQEAVNAQDETLLLQLSHPDIEMVGPRGTAKGHEILVTWLERAGLTLETRRVFAKGDAVVFSQYGVWRPLAAGELQGEAKVASSFLVQNGQITEVARYDTLAEALAHAGSGEADEVLS